MRDRNRRENATLPNKVFVGSYASTNPSSADFTNTDAVSRNAKLKMEVKEPASIRVDKINKKMFKIKDTL